MAKVDPKIVAQLHDVHRRHVSTGVEPRARRALADLRVPLSLGSAAGERTLMGAFVRAAALRRSDKALVLASLAEARRPLPKVATDPGAPAAEWRRAAEERSDRQTVALEGLLRLAEAQGRVQAWTLALAAISAVAGVVAVIVAL